MRFGLVVLLPQQKRINMKIINLSIDVTKIDKKKLIVGKKGTYLALTVMVKDEKDQYGNDVSAALAQSKEEREAKTPSVFVGNGKVVWEGQTTTKAAPKVAPAPDEDSLPF
jgi:hypothetical protein